MQGRAATLRLQNAFLRLGSSGQTEDAGLESKENQTSGNSTTNSGPADSFSVPGQMGLPSHYRPALEVEHFAPSPVVTCFSRHSSAMIQKCLQQIRQAVRSRPRVVGFAAAEPHQGCTTVLLVLAYQIVREGEKVLLIDGTPDGGLAEALGVVVERGWQDAVGERLSLREVTIHSLQDGFDIVPSRRVESAPTSVVRSACLLPEWLTHYQWIFIDYGCTLASSHSRENDSEEIRKLTPRLNSIPFPECRDFVAVQRFDSARNVIRELPSYGQLVGLIETFAPDSAEANSLLCARDAA